MQHTTHTNKNAIYLAHLHSRDYLLEIQKDTVCKIVCKMVCKI